MPFDFFKTCIYRYVEKGVCLWKETYTKQTFSMSTGRD